MSYKRPDTILTRDKVEYCTYVVRESECEEYKKSVDDILVIPNGAALQNGDNVNDFMSTFYWIIENTKEDVICILDDDIEKFYYTLNDSQDIKTKELASTELERIAQLMVDLNIGFACDRPVSPLYTYDREFQFFGTPGAIRWINKKAFKAKYSQNDPSSGDIDMVLQELLMNRIILVPKYLNDQGANIGKNKGGSTYTSKEEYDRLLSMKRKWGKYFSFNFKRNINNINVKR